ncbi:14304_t:CDS:1, partial [Dentiscutata heterogama]
IIRLTINLGLGEEKPDPEKLDPEKLDPRNLTLAIMKGPGETWPTSNT